jgi:2-desacetyl-2-hydroxyethyl bacteriochlorophyllide A dehydrogenase
MSATRVRFHGDGKARYETFCPAGRPPRPGHLRIRPEAIGVCATDLEILDGTLVYYRSGSASYPITPGHEWAGTVAEVGERVEGFQAGDRVVGQPHVSCQDCHLCRRGLPQLCPRRAEGGVMNLDGAMSPEMDYPARSVHKVSGHVPAADAAMAEPLAIALRAIHQLGEPRPDEPVLVNGAGAIGCLVVMGAREQGLPVFVNDLRRGRLDVAARYGAVPALAGQQFLKVVDTTGAAAGVQHSLGRLAEGGSLVVVGLTGSALTDIPLDSLVVKEQRILGTLGSEGAWDTAIDLLNSGSVEPSSLITHVFDFDDYAEALRLLASGDPEVGKIQMRGAGTHSSPSTTATDRSSS